MFLRQRAFSQGDDVDKKTIKRLLPEMDLVPSLYARGEEPLNLKTLPKFSATKMFGYPIAKKETVEAERGFWKASKEIYAKKHPLRAAIFEAMDETAKLPKDFPMMTLAAPIGPKEKVAFLTQQEPIGIAIFKLKAIVRQMAEAAEKRDQEASNRWKANFDLARARTLGNVIFLYEYNFTLGQIRADNLPELGPDRDGWRIAFSPKINVPEGEAKAYAKELAKLLTKIQEEHAGTPWAYFAERDSKRNMGMTWEPRRKEGDK